MFKMGGKVLCKDVLVLRATKGDIGSPASEVSLELWLTEILHGWMETVFPGKILGNSLNESSPKPDLTPWPSLGL